MDNINPEEKPKITVASNPKSFVACTSTERIRKISVVKNDFRPIVEGRQYNKEKSDEPEKQQQFSSSSSSSSMKRNSKDESTADETKSASSSGSSKRKRKRKSTMKRKGAQRKISMNSGTGEVGSVGKTPEMASVIEPEKSVLDSSVSI